MKPIRSIINEAAAKSPVKPLVNLGQGFFGYNPPEYILDAVKDCLHKVDCNQYAPPKVGLHRTQSGLPKRLSLTSSTGTTSVTQSSGGRLLASLRQTTRPRDVHPDHDWSERGVPVYMHGVH